jgi:hypothetical protein
MIAEPTTAITDYVLSAVTAALAWRLFRRRQGQRARELWAVGFVALALTALLGGTYHGFGIAALWPPTLLLAGVASFGMLAGSVMATTTGALRRAVLGVAALKVVAYVAWTIGHDDFIAVVLDSGLAMAGVAVMHARPALRGHDRAARAMLGGVAVSVLGVLVQASGFTLHRHVNHNDLFHVIQLAGTILFYAGARRLRDRP